MSRQRLQFSPIAYRQAPETGISAGALRWAARRPDGFTALPCPTASSFHTACAAAPTRPVVESFIGSPDSFDKA